MSIGHDGKDRDTPGYLTYDDRSVSRTRIDRVVHSLENRTYRTYDERVVSRAAILAAIAGSITVRERLIRLRGRIVMAAAIGIVCVIVLVAWLVYAG